MHSNTLFIFSLLTLSAFVVGNQNEAGSSMIRRQTGTQAAVHLGTSNPPIEQVTVNPLGDTTPLVGQGETLADFAGSKNAKRQTGTAAVVVIGKSNPPINANEVNPLGDTTPLVGQQGTLADFSSSTNPNSANDRMIKRSDLNLISHDIATRGFAGGRIEIIGTRSLASVEEDDEDEE